MGQSHDCYNSGGSPATITRSGGTRHITAIPPSAESPTVTRHELASGAVVIAVIAQPRPGGPALAIDLTAVAAGIRRWLVANRHPVLLPLTITGLGRVFDIRPALAGALPCLGDGQDG